MLKWGAGPLVAALLAATLSAFVAGRQRGPLFARTTHLTPADQKSLAAAPLRAVANAVWALGTGGSAQKALKAELDVLPDSEGPRLARTLLRLTAVEQNPEGQAAILNQACGADPTVCDHLKEAAERETELRYVYPGNHLPMIFLPSGHPRIASP
jgi:hypothetical protein